MKKKTPLHLEDLKIKSFTTSEEKKVIGGWLTGKFWCSGDC
ncbi:MAG: pinensin family lanthipeptide [Acidobacteriota bacterium]|nr:pinensin family lanthipeptide [Acidobacteriota bacterium]